MVYAARWLLPLLALLVIVALVAWPFLQTKTENVLQQVPQNKVVPAAPEPALTVIKPEFKGVDNQQRPYHIVAEKVQQGVDATQPATLQNTTATLVLSADNTLTLNAQQAVFNKESNSLQLLGAVSLQNTQGYTMHTEALSVDLNQKTATSQTAITAVGPMGTLTGAGFDLTQDAQLLKVHGPAKLILQKLDKK
jgi:lipopolysaccharide export system protein LptC